MGFIRAGESAAARCLRACPVRAYHLGVPDVVDASPGTIGSQSVTNALSVLAGAVRMGKRCYAHHQRATGAGFACDGGESGAVYSDRLATLASGNRRVARRIIR